MSQLVIHIDGGSRGNPGPAAAGIVIQDAEGLCLLEAGYFLGRMTNNQAEYSALVRALKAARAARAREVRILSDSELMVNQLNGKYRVKNPGLAPLFAEAVRLLGEFDRWSISHVPRALNARADELANRALDARADVVEMEFLNPHAMHTNSERKAGTKATPPPAIGDAAEHSDGSSRALPRRRGTSGQGEDETALGTRGSNPESRRPGGGRSATNHTVVRVTCARAADDAACPAACAEGDAFAFGPVVPPGICMGAAQALLWAVTQARLTGGDVAAVCPIRGCGARFVARREGITGPRE